MHHQCSRGHLCDFQKVRQFKIPVILFQVTDHLQYDIVLHAIATEFLIELKKYLVAAVQVMFQKSDCSLLLGQV